MIQSWTLGADEAGVKAAGDAGIGGALDDRAAVREDGYLDRERGRNAGRTVLADVAMRPQTGLNLVEIDGPMAFVNLDRIATT